MGWKAIAKSWRHRNAHTSKNKYDWALFSSWCLVSQHCNGIVTVSLVSLCQSHSLEFVLFHLVLAPGVGMNFKTRGKLKELAHSGVLALIFPEPLTHSVMFSKAVDLPVLCTTQLESGVKKKKSNGNFTQKWSCKEFLDKQITQAHPLQPPPSSSLHLIAQARSSLKWKVWGCVFLHVLDPPLTVKMFKVKTWPGNSFWMTLLWLWNPL